MVCLFLIALLSTLFYQGSVVQLLVIVPFHSYSSLQMTQAQPTNVVSAFGDGGKGTRYACVGFFVQFVQSMQLKVHNLNQKQACLLIATATMVSKRASILRHS